MTPSNLRILDELFFVTGKKIIPAVAPEVRLYQALEKYYGERRTPRFAILAEKLSRPTAPSVIQKPLPPPPDFSSSARELPPGLAPGNPDAPTLLEAWRVPDVSPVGWGGLPPPPEEATEHPESIAWEETPSTARGRRPPPRLRPARLGRPARSGDAAGGTGVAPDSRCACPCPRGPPQAAGCRRRPTSPGSSPRAAGTRSSRPRCRRSPGAFDAAPSSWFVRTGSAAGPGRASGSTLPRCRRFDLSWTEPSIFLNVRMSRSFYLGALPPLARHEELAAALGGWPAECLVQPVLMREKTVAFFYAECREAQGASPADLTYVRELAGATAAALAASIRLRKKQVI